MDNLAVTLRVIRQRDKAAMMIKEVLEKRRRILSNKHLDTISTTQNLASTLRDLG
jgi:hypothetical protein